MITTKGTRLIIDQVMPHFDATRVEALAVEAPAESVFRAMRSLDLLQVHSPLMDAAMFLRGLPVRLARLRRGEGRVPMPPAAVIGDLFDRGPSEGEGPFDGWVPLGEDPGVELVFGAVGDFFHGDFSWKPIEPDRLAGFDEPGYGVIAAALTAVPFGDARSVVSYEARTRCTDPDSRRRFLRYWRLTSPFIGVVMKATLRTIADHALQEPPVTVPTTSATG